MLGSEIWHSVNVLVKDNKCNFIWEPEVGNQIPEGAIKVGYNNNKEDLYIAKTSTSPRSFLIAQSAESKFIFRLSIYVVHFYHEW